ncbi:MAG: sensor histidine kinase, partial [Proteobacteria bacterium]
PEPWCSARETPLSHSFCQHVVRTEQPLVVTNAKENPLVKDNLAIPDLGVLAYLGMPIRLKSGAVIGSFCAIDGKVRDWSTSDMAALEDLAASVVSEIELRSALRAQDEVMAIVSHDLKNPIGAVMLAAELLMRKVDAGKFATPAEMMPSLKRIRGLGTRMEALVHEVLDQARLNSGPIALSKTPENARALIEAASESIAGQAAQKGVQLQLAADLGSYVVTCDRPRLLQVLGNVIGNAVEYTPPGKTVSVRAEASANSLVILVCDEGPGIAHELREQIFEKFWRAPGSKGRGHGLGLFIVRTLVEAHGGNIRVIDVPGGQGVCFRVEIPTNA